MPTYPAAMKPEFDALAARVSTVETTRPGYLDIEGRYVTPNDFRRHEALHSAHGLEDSQQIL